MKKTISISTPSTQPFGSGTDSKAKSRSLEDAISLAGHGKYQWCLLFGVGLSLFAMIFETVSNSYLLPSAQCDFNMSTADKGLLNSAIYIGMMVSSHLWGFLADTKGRRKLLIITLLLNSTCSIIASLVPVYTLFVVIRFFNGIFICCASAVSYAYLGEFHTNKTRTKALLWATVFLAFGTVCLPALAWLVIPQTWAFELPWCVMKSWRIFVIICTLPAISASLFLKFVLLESPKFLLAVKREDEALEVLQKLYALNTGNDPDLFPVTSLKAEDENVIMATSHSPLAILQSMWEQTKPIFVPPYLLCTLLACFIQFGLYASANGFLLWLPDLFNRLEQFKINYPNDTLTVCGAVAAYSPFLTNYETSSSKYLSNNSAIPNELFENEIWSNFSVIQEVSTITTVDTTVSDIFQSNSGIEAATEICTADVSMGAFQNTLIIGATTAAVLASVNFLLDYMQKKTILVIFLVASGICGCALYFAHNSAEVLVLATGFVALSSMCISVINSVVVDAIPTHLRAMALCLSLMMGRVGTMCSNLMLGALLDVNCAFVVFFLSGLVVACGVLSFFLPTSKNQKQEANNQLL